MTTERLLSPSQVARTIAPLLGGTPVSPATITRWIVDGTKLRDGGRLQLRALRLPRGFRIAMADVDAFIAELTRDRTGVRPTITANERSRRAEAELQMSGW